MLIDKPLAELELYKPSLTRQHDFDAFWEQTLRTRPEVGSIALTGGSQGGGLTLATAALARDKGV